MIVIICNENGVTILITRLVEGIVILFGGLMAPSALAMNCLPCRWFDERKLVWSGPYDWAMFLVGFVML